MSTDLPTFLLIAEEGRDGITGEACFGADNKVTSVTVQFHPTNNLIDKILSLEKTSQIHKFKVVKRSLK